MLLPTPQRGQQYPPASWEKLGLPAPEELKGLTLRVTRKFFWPFGIIHSKYIVIDRRLAIFPSCNVSWERWFEVAVLCRGPVVEHLLSFHDGFWENRERSSTTFEHAAQDDLPEATGSHATGVLNILAPTTVLPSPHAPALLPNYMHPAALLGHCPCLPDAALGFPPTPLLKTTYHLLSTASSTITMLTPNLTEPTVLEVLLQALARRVKVRIWTNRTLMTMEQLVTAGTTTPTCVETLQNEVEQMDIGGHLLEVSYFDGDDGPGAQHPVLREINQYRETVPVKLHAKVTIVDGERILLGSGNMDAASWRTSQELGILIESRDVVHEFVKLWKYGKLEV
jgi:phosphatidylserine/phosphatidylglycerophosphate/cardiolipin synthase-like enzyme